jgi:photosystem II stability/assembly factor-like uncharacterized protein
VLAVAVLACTACGPAASGNPTASGATGTPPVQAPPGTPPATPAATAPATPATAPGTASPAVTASAAQPASSAGLTCAGLPSTAAAYGQPVAADNSPLVAIAFVSAQRGWVAGNGRVLVTSDTGRSWITQYSGPADLDQLDFIDAEHGWAVGEDTVLATSDGGATWTAVTDPCAAIRSVHFVSPDLGFAVFGGTTVDQNGGYPAVQDGGRLLRTEDGGRTWHVAATAPASVQTACFSDPDDGFLATPGKVWRSTDGGLTWTATLTEPGPAEVAGAGPPTGPSQAAGTGAANTTVVECAGRSGAWADVISVGAALSHKGYIAYSTRDGQDWHALFAELYTESSAFPKGIQWGPGSYPGPFSAISADSAVYVGYSPPIGYGTATVDVVTGDTAVSDHGNVGGLTDPFGAAFLDTERGWVVGEDQTQPGQWGDAVIEATTDGGRTWIRQYEVPWRR